jgi:hypothetical protein
MEASLHAVAVAGSLGAGVPARLVNRFPDQDHVAVILMGKKTSRRQDRDLEGCAAIRIRETGNRPQRRRSWADSSFRWSVLVRHVMVMMARSEGKA